MKKLILKKDFIIPKGTEFIYDKDCNSTFYGDTNFRLDFTLQDTSCMTLFVSTDTEDDRFEVISQ